MPRADSWVVVRHYDDGLAARIALDFLRDHGVPVAVRGNSGATAILNRFDTVLDVRLVVRPKHVARALEALTALESPGTPIEQRDELLPTFAGSGAGAPVGGHPYRDVTEPPETRTRYRRAAFALALMLPIGSGHFYAGENVAGAALTTAIAGCAVAAVALRDDRLLLASMVVVACDALLSVRAVARANAGAPASAPRQVLCAAACTLFAALFALLVS